MKKGLLILFLIGLSLPLFAQLKVTEKLFKDYQQVYFNKIDRSSSNKTNKQEPNATWLNFSEALIAEFSNGRFWPMPMWPDSTVVTTNSIASPIYYDIHGFVNILDPVSSYFSNYVAAQQNLLYADQWFSNSKEYKIDSVRFYYNYTNPNKSVDTLKVYLILPGSSAFSTVPVEINNEPVNLLLVQYNHINNRPAGSNIIEHTILLKEKDTVGLPNVKEYVIPVDITLPANNQNISNKVGIAFKYIPGHQYKTGDTLIDQSASPLSIKNKLNVFRLLTYEETYINDISSYPISYMENTLNQSGIASKSVRYNMNNLGWNGRYINTFAFGAAFAYEHAYIDWHIKPNGTVLTFDSTICVGRSINFNAHSNFNPDNWLWDFGNGSTSTLQNPTHTYNSPGAYTIALTSWNNTDTFYNELVVNVNWCTNIEEKEHKGFKIWPNPVVNKLHIEKGNETIKEIVIRNAAGLIVLRVSPNQSDKVSVDLQYLPKGFYLIEILSAGGKEIHSLIKL